MFTGTSYLVVILGRWRCHEVLKDLFLFNVNVFVLFFFPVVIFFFSSALEKKDSNSTSTSTASGSAASSSQSQSGSTTNGSNGRMDRIMGPALLLCVTAALLVQFGWTP